MKQFREKKERFYNETMCVSTSPTLLQFTTKKKTIKCKRRFIKEKHRFIHSLLPPNIRCETRHIDVVCWSLILKLQEGYWARNYRLQHTVSKCISNCLVGWNTVARHSKSCYSRHFTLSKTNRARNVFVCVRLILYIYIMFFATLATVHMGELAFACEWNPVRITPFQTIVRIKKKITYSLRFYLHTIFWQ